ncbi:AbiH family protein [Sphingobacterium mizutaii]|uniref:AbiH family protein n=1 Tax=Sphingobacterium mizutaii TaxID=1010 RepID=UPI0028B03896|nr:AbiH family protein [Sphingobacterium mizutaii]
MNRLILIGNGFDLALGLKTCYKDFIFWYLDECFNKAGMFANGQFYEDEFIRVEILEHYRLMNLARNAGEEGISKYLYNKGELINYLDYKYDQTYTSPTNIKKYNFVSESLAHVIFLKSNYFKNLLYTCLDCGWVDIEQEYFNALKKFNDKNNSHNPDYVRKLNKNFEYLKQKLEEYLTIQDAQFDQRLNFQLAKLLGQEFDVNDFDPSIADDELRTKLGKDDSVPNEHKVYVLNFNYTNTFYNYIKEVKGNYFTRIEINHIHGQLNNSGNPIIFGFGDEYDKDYAQFEEQGNNDLFEHVKSYHYLKKSNYRNLIRFLNEDYFQVFVVGHSCGLSDRTMFKTILDHDNCKSVRIFHYTNEDGKNDFFDKSINLGRHFTDKGRMRKLIVNFKEVDAIPQFER